MVYSTPKTSLKLGANNYEVTRLQQLLAQKLGPVPMTGVFDYETEIAVKTFQSRMFLKPDGVVDFLTWQALCSNAPVGMPTLRQGCHGSAVESLQEILSIDLYYIGAIDGDFGPKTREAVRRFQVDFSIPAGGIVEAKTWQALSQI
ncbi:MAG: peptidoglycan-binding protein [Cyanobacteria bacterium P01_D01_bin.56]